LFDNYSKGYLITMSNNELRSELHDIIKLEKEFMGSREFLKAQEMYSKWISKATQGGNLVQKSKTRNNKKYSNDVWKFYPAHLITQEIIDENFRNDVALAFNNRGQLRYLKVDFDGAVEDYNKSIEFNPSLPSAYYNRGTIFYRMGKKTD
jgi:tetratricopeptide (TPR) repeat protein